MWELGLLSLFALCVGGALSSPLCRLEFPFGAVASPLSVGPGRRRASCLPALALHQMGQPELLSVALFLVLSLGAPRQWPTWPGMHTDSLAHQSDLPPDPSSDLLAGCPGASDTTFLSLSFLTCRMWLGKSLVSGECGCDTCGTHSPPH